MKAQTKDGKSPKATPKRKAKKRKPAKALKFSLTLNVFVYPSDGDTAASGERPPMICN